MSIILDRVSDFTLGRSVLQGFDPAAATPATGILALSPASLYDSLLIPFHLLDFSHHFLAPIIFYRPSIRESRIALDTIAVRNYRDFACGFLL